MARLVLLFLFFTVPATASAQIIPSVGSLLEVETIPSTVEPNESFTVRAHLPGNVSGSATYIWTVNGVVVEQGVGRSAVSLEAGGAGSVTSVSVSVSEGGVLRVQKEIVVNPASVDLVWEGNTYVPSLYQGRPLPTGSSSITLLATPDIIQNGARVSANDLVYYWYVNDAQAPKKTGYGGNSFTLTTPQFENEFTVSVVVETRDGGVRARNQVSIKPVRPDIVIYQDAPLLGIRFDKVISSMYRMQNGEVTFTIFPYFITNTNDPLFAWFVNNLPADEGSAEPRAITFRKTAEGQATFSISATLENNKKLFESAEKNFVLTF